jgi:hypothetical protein
MGDKSDTFTVTTMSLDERLLLVVDVLDGYLNDTYVGTEDDTLFAYTGNNFIPTAGSGDPATCDILASDFVNIFGHTPFKKPLQVHGKHWCIDTGCFLSGILTALDLDTMTFYNNKGYNYANIRRKIKESSHVD